MYDASLLSLKTTPFGLGLDLHLFEVVSTIITKGEGALVKT